ncbi:8759_t:CDS:2 [Cetraspora pellucida]|uniref:8759_t:CDS:1 n=1 Tax=Cetraspora pellucida TaxID=1433469 RepID=A0A9N9J1B0_9GLOM|nr:8759_t:CDS:2 [Cetraspora pellucida]
MGEDDDDIVWEEELYNIRDTHQQYEVKRRGRPPKNPENNWETQGKKRKSVDENLLLGTDWFQKARAMVNFDEQKLVIRYLGRRFEVPIMHTDKGKQKEYVNEDMRSGDHDGDENDDDDLFEEFEYESEDLEEVESYSTDSIPVGEVSESESEGRIDDENVEESPAVCLAVMEEVPTEKKVPVDEKPPVEDQLVRIVDGVNIEAQYKVNVEQLFKANEDLFANGLEELGQTNLVKHVIKTGDVEPIKQAPYHLAPSEQEFVPTQRNKAVKQVRSAQLKQKAYYDRHIKVTPEFHVGTKVLLFDAAHLMSRSHKLNQKWKGPFFVHKVLANGSYKIRTLDGQVVKSPINKAQLKEYHEARNHLR